jgi:penicillin-binding protein 1A
MGITSKQPSNLTIALGTGEVTPFELANAYATLASGGYFAEPITIRKIVDSNGVILKEAKLEPKEAINPATAFVVSHMMTSVVQEGTAAKARRLERPLAGKTGTTNQSKNAWFGGFSPELVSVVWVGFDDNTSMGKLTGSSAALPIWVNFMEEALKSIPKTQFIPPSDVVFRRVDRDTGEPTNDVGSIEEVFLPGTEPEMQSQELPSLFIEDEEP